MSISRKILFLLVFLVPLPGLAAVTNSDFPGSTIWYLHANLDQMRTATSGKALYDWIDAEVFAEIQKEVGIDVNEEVDSLTAFSSTDHSTVIVIDGNISQETRDKMLAIAVLKGKLDTREGNGYEYHRIWDIDDGHAGDGNHDANPMQDFDGEAFLGFVGDSKVIVTSREAELLAMLDKGGAIAGSGSHDGALFVLTADKAFVQAGLKTDSLKGEDQWQSNIIRNTEQAALMVSGMNELIAIEAKLVSTEAAMARSIGGIVNGLIGLQAFNSELDPRIRSVIENTRVEVEDNVLSVATVVDPDLIVAVLADD